MSHGISITWHGHSTWSIHTPSSHILIDPFLDQNPAASRKAIDLSPTHILVSHGHFDHIADAASIANRTGAQLLANYEIASWLEKNHGVQNGVGMNLGGSIKTTFGNATLTNALHSSSLPDGSYGGTAGGWLIEIATPGGDTKRIYYAGDTALFSDMQLIGRRGIDCFIVPIGDLFTMGPSDSIDAISLVNPKLVLPTHFNTWPPIAQDPLAWARLVTEKTSAKAATPEIDTPMLLEC